MSQEQGESLDDARSAHVTAALLELKCLAPNEELYKCVQKVAEDYKQNPNIPGDNLNKLILAINTTLKQIKEPQSKASSYLCSYMPSFPSIPSLPRLQYFKKPKVYPVVTAQTFGAHTEILKRINVEECGAPADCDVVVVFCPVTSRVGSDVDDAMRNIPGEAHGKRVILVVMHHLREDVSLTDAQPNHGHENVIKDVHVLYHQTKKGLIQSERNDKTVQELKDFCKKLAP